jgi:hypothetical protein
MNKKTLRAGVAVGAGVVVIIAAGAWYVHRHIPADLLPDLRAAVAARHEGTPQARLNKYLEGRYGPLTDPANRRRAFEDFFHPRHIRAMQLIIQHSPAEQRQANIQATADWLANYRQTLSPAEKTALAEYYQSEAGRADLRSTNAQYMNQDAVYRNATVPVINELMVTLNSVKK